MTKLKGRDIIIAYPSYPCGGIGVAIWRCDRWTGGQNVWRFCRGSPASGNQPRFPSLAKILGALLTPPQIAPKGCRPRPVFGEQRRIFLLNFGEARQRL